MPSIVLGNRQFTYEVNRKSIISLRLQIVSPTSFQISAPRLTPDFVVRRFITSQSSWILKHAATISPKIKIANIKSLEIVGEKYKIIQRLTSTDSLVIFKDSKQIHLNASSFSENHLRQLYDKKLRTLALSLIKSELTRLSHQFGFSFNRLSIRNQSSRFGSCSTRGNLNFNWQIILFPPEQFRHVLLHELTHLEHHNHSKAFWHQLSLYDPNWKINNLWLKKQGTKRFIL